MSTLGHTHATAQTPTASAGHPTKRDGDGPPNIMTRLRDATQVLHDQAEASPFQKGMTAGELPVETYVAQLEQLYHVHDALERHLHALRGASAVASAVLRDEHFQTPYLREDLKHFGRPPGESKPTWATSQLIAAFEHAAKSCPISLLGAQYVMEGSNNGSKFIAKRLMSAYGLKPGPGLRYVDPYGDSQRAVWTAFKEAMSAQTITDADAIAMVGMARWTFVGIMALGEELYAEGRTR